MSDAVIILTTVPSQETGTQLGHELVRRGLVACVNVLPPMVSVYMWKGVIQQDRECQLIIKTIGSRVAAVQAAVREVHPYELPELLVVPVSGGDPAYLAWVAASSTGEA